MPVKNLSEIDMSFFQLGRNGEQAPTDLEVGQNVEQKNIRTIKNTIQNRPGERLKGSEISSTKEILGIGKWKSNIVSSNNGNILIDTTDHFNFKTGLDATARTSFFEYFNDLYVSNGVDNVFRAVRSDLNGTLSGGETIINLDDAGKFIQVDSNKVHANSTQTGFIDGDSFTYLGVSAGTIISKVFIDSPYTTTLTETTINYDATGGNSTVNLITAVGNTNKIYIIRKSDSSANTITIDADSTETIDSDLTQVLSNQGDFVMIKSDGVNWVSTSSTFAGLTILDNVSGVLAHADNSVVVTTFDIADAQKGLALSGYRDKFWIGNVTESVSIPTNPFRLYFSVSATAQNPEQFRDFTSSGSGQQFIADSGEITALLENDKVLLIGTSNGIKLINDFIDAIPPIPDFQDFFKSDGPINERCMIKVGSDVIYFTGKRIQRLFVPDFDTLQVDSGFDDQVLDVLKNDLDEDQSEANMHYNRSTGLMFISVKTKDSPFNDLRIMFSTDTRAWWIEENSFCNDYVEIDGTTFYGHSITGRIVQDSLGSTKDGSSDLTEFQSFHVRIDNKRKDWRHLTLEGSITRNTIITTQMFVDNNLVHEGTITSADIVDSPSISEAIGDETMADTMWGGGLPGEPPIDPKEPFEKVIPIGRHGKIYYYILKTVGLAQRFEIEQATVTVVPRNERYRLQASN